MTLKEALRSLTVIELKQRCSQVPDLRPGNVKDSLVNGLAGYLLSDSLATLVAGLTELDRNAIAETLYNWNGSFSAVAFKAKYDALPDHFTYDPYLWLGLGRSKTKHQPSTLKLFFFGTDIPTDLAARLAQLVPEPPPMQVVTLDDEQLPETVTIKRFSGDEPEPLRRADTEMLAHQDLPAVLRLIAEGGIGVGAKTGLPSAAAIRRLESVLLGGDWYDADDDEDTPRWAGGPIRPIRPFAWPLLLQTGGLAKIDGSKLGLTAKGKKALSQPVHEVVKQLYERWQRKGSPDELRRVDLIKGQTSKGVRLTAPMDRRLVIEDALRASCPVGEWLAVDDLFRQMKAEGHRFDVSGNPWKLYLSDANYGSLGYDGAANFEILEARYTLTYLFEYLATLGMIDIAYSRPYRARPDYYDHWGADDIDFLSRYDGLRYLRLNALGAYCLDLTEHYVAQLAERPPLFRMDADLQLELLRPAEPAEQLQLEQIAKSLSADRWGLNTDVIFNRSADADERERIRAFLEASVEGDLPAEASNLLARIEERATALTDAGPARLIQCRDAALAAMLSSDPATAAHCSRAGERQLCVPQKKLNAFRKGLAKLDFVLPELAP
ncbi:MAG: hypothetical protein K9L82_11985 [Chromatiaceae bacterium]|nr:hypothetical protein [Chromatiaceae bacterium]MCF8015873.1 hypothetical protein [Chromatiaceae bacterium]